MLDSDRTLRAPSTKPSRVARQRPGFFIPAFSAFRLPFAPSPVYSSPLMQRHELHLSLALTAGLIAAAAVVAPVAVS